MRSRGFTIAAIGVLIVAIGTLAWAVFTQSPNPEAPATGTPSGQSVTANGVTLASTAIVLPEEKATLPAGSDLITLNCTACHSPEMILTQPVLNAEKWKAEVKKMRAVYHATIASADDAALVQALVALQAKSPPKP